jgi:hypothetical protein
MIRLIPFKSGEIPLKSGRIDFMWALMDLTEKEYPLIPIVSWDTHNLKDYGREIGDEGFMLFKIQKYARRSWFYFTTVHCRIIEKESGLVLKYHIRLNLFSNALILLYCWSMCHMLYHDIFVDREFSWKFWLLALFLIAAQGTGFYKAAKEHEGFLMKLVNHKT